MQNWMQCLNIDSQKKMKNTQEHCPLQNILLHVLQTGDQETETQTDPETTMMVITTGVEVPTEGTTLLTDPMVTIRTDRIITVITVITDGDISYTPVMVENGNKERGHHTEETDYW